MSQYIYHWKDKDFVITSKTVTKTVKGKEVPVSKEDFEIKENNSKWYQRLFKKKKYHCSMCKEVTTELSDWCLCSKCNREQEKMVETMNQSQKDVIKNDPNFKQALNDMIKEAEDDMKKEAEDKEP